MNEHNSRIGIIMIILLTVLSYIPLQSLKFDFKSEKFFPDGDPELSFFQAFEEQFQSYIDDEYIFIALRNQSGIFNRPFLEKTDSLTRYIKGLPNIIKIYSLTASNPIYLQGEDVNAKPLIHIDNPALYAADSQYLFKSPEYRDLLVSSDGRSVAIAAFNKQFLTNPQKDALLDSIQQKINELKFDQSYLTAKIRVEREYAGEIARNLKKYMAITLTLICLCLFLLFRSVKIMILPLLIIAVSNIWTMALISLTGHSLDIISSLLPPILAAIAMSDVVHISTHYIEQLRKGYPKMEALNKTYREIGLATFYTCCTVAAGFITLGITDIIPIRNFGFFAAAGIFFAFIITMICLYVYFSSVPIPSVVYKKTAETRWQKVLSGCLRYILRRPRTVFLVFFLLLAGSFYYMGKVEINSSLLQEIPKKNTMLNDYRFMETDFSGTRPFEMALSMTDSSKSIYDPAVMKKVEQLEHYLKDSCGVGNIISPLSLFKGANKAFHGGNVDSFLLPRTKEEILRYHEAILQTDFAEEFRHYVAAGGRRIRISGRLPNLSVKEFEPVSNKIEKYISKNNFPFTAHLTGSAVLLDKITYSLTNNLLSGILFDVLIISLIAFLLIRNWKVILIILIPNVAPLFFMAGMMGLLGINLKADTSVIFAIALGLAVDDSIHFLSRVRMELSKGRSIPYAVKRTYLSTGKAIIITAMVLLSGFLTLLSSSFGGAFYIGLLISLCLFIAMLMELTITPLLLLYWLKPKKRKEL